MRSWVLPLLGLCCCSEFAAGFLLPMGIPGANKAMQHRSFSGLAQVYSAVQDPPVATGGAAAIAGAPVEEEDDINDHFEEEPEDMTPEQMAALNREEMATVIPGDGRTIGEWLEKDAPVFKDGSKVADWVKEAHRLRVLPFIERAEHLKSLSFDDLNLFRARANEWRDLMVKKGILEPHPQMEEEGVTTLSREAFTEKLNANKSKFKKAAQEEQALFDLMDGKLLSARFEGTAMDGKVKVVMNGRMEPLSCEVSDGAMGDAQALSTAVEAAMEAAFKRSSEFYEETLAADYLAKAKSPTDVQGIFEAFGEKEFATVADVVDPSVLK